MPKLPKNVISCLRHSQNVADSHPDANALAAFASRAVGRKQRSEIMRHLARCPECRDVVVAIAPERQVSPKRMLWWTAPLGAGLAAALVAGIFWVREPRSLLAPTMEYEVMASRRASAPASAPPVAETRAPQVLSPHIARHRRRAQQHKRTVAPVLPSELPRYDAGATPGAQPEIMSFANQRTMQPAAAVARMVQLPGPIWTLGSGRNQPNTLLRSTDAGRTWTPFPLDPNARYTALLSQGSDVWVGTSDGSLWHSGDGGKLWTQLHLPIAAHEAITQIGSNSPANVRVTLSNGESWASTDYGTSWTRVSK